MCIRDSANHAFHSLPEGDMKEMMARSLKRLRNLGKDFHQFLFEQEEKRIAKATTKKMRVKLPKLKKKERAIVLHLLKNLGVQFCDGSGNIVNPEMTDMDLLLSIVHLLRVYSRRAAEVRETNKPLGPYAIPSMVESKE